VSSRTSARRGFRELSVRTKLLALVGVPFAAFTLLLLGVLAAYWISARADDEATLWARHTAVIEKVDASATELVYAVSTKTADGASLGGPGNLAPIERKLAAARAESTELAREFSAEEQRQEDQLDAALEELMTRANEVHADPDRGAAIRAFFAGTVVPLLEVRVAQEIGGTAEASARSDRVRGWASLGASGLAVGILVVGFVICLRMARRFAARILTLEQRARRVAAGNLAALPHVESTDELGRLAGSIDDMVETLREQRQNQFSFLASVAHDFRGSLGVIQLTADRLRQVLDDEKALQQSASVIQRAIAKLSRLATDLIDASRIEAGEFKLERELVDVRTVAREITDQYAKASPKHEVHGTITDEPLIVLADPTRLSQVLDNLVSNAIKYSPEGGPIEIDATEDHDSAVLSVTDRGRGIPEPSLHKIFEPFHRDSNVAVGIGLGLAIARSLVDAHGGVIAVESVVGQGSTFSVRIPLARVISEGAGP
jgi:signal transduction histidine kinase